VSEYTFLLIGCGRIAQRHIVYIKQVGKLIAVCDINQEKAISIAENTSAEWYHDYAEMFRKHATASVVVICTPNGLHAKQSIDALNAGFNVLCEKPMAINSNDVSAMLMASEKNERRLFVVKQNRFNPPVQAVKRILTENRLGKIYSIQLTCFWNRPVDYYADSWRGTRMLDGGTLFTQFSHFIDLLYWYFGDVHVISAVTKNAAHGKHIEFEDEGVALLQLNNDIIGTLNYSVNTWQKNMEGSLTIIGEKGTVKIGGEYLNKLEYQCIDEYKMEELSIGNAANEYGTYKGSMSNHGEVYKNLIATLNGTEPMATNGYEAGKTVEIIEEIYRKAIHY
jgi:UDP-N-acetyl-2-amino-2-deoxyglucuronate dehydrogenase